MPDLGGLADGETAAAGANAALRSWRESAGMTRREMADTLNSTPTGQRERLSCDEDRITSWESGQTRAPRWRYQQALQELTGRSARSLGFTGPLAAHTASTAGPTLADVQAECPRWRCWRGLRSGIYYAITADWPTRGGYQLQADTPASLLEQIRDADASGQQPPVVLFASVAVRPRMATDTGSGGRSA